MSKKNIKLNLHQEPADDRSLLTYLSSQLFITVFIYIALCLVLISAFKFANITFYLMIVGIIPIIFLYFVRNKRLRTIIGLGFIGLITVMFIIFNKFTINGLFLSLNHIAEIIGVKTTYVLPNYKVLIDADMYSVAMNIFIIYLFIFIGLISYLIVKKNLIIVLWLIIISVFSLEIITGIYPALYYNIGLFIAILAVSVSSFINKSTSGFNLSSKRTTVGFFTGLIVSGILIITVVITSTITPHENYEKNKKIMQVEENLKSKLLDFRYKKQPVDSLTQGDFLKLNKLALTDKEALEVVMENPQPYYLRGFVGSEYSRNTWKEIKNKDIYNNRGLLYSLNEVGFHPLAQLSLVNELSLLSEEEVIKNQITINNINADSRYLYTPYEIDDTIENIAETHYFNEANLKAKGLKGVRNYSYEATEGLVTHYPAIANRLYKNKDKEVIKQYLTYEAYYNRFVYDQFTTISKEVEQVLGTHFADEVGYSGERMSYEQAIDEVTSFLKDTYDYDKSPPRLNRDRDFLSFLLEESGTGYAPHYATSATLMFRYLGIPSRYVEGYLVTPDSVKDKKTYEKISVTGKEAHAWTEIYFDEIGWIPIEVTPEYEGVMPPVDMTDYPKGKWSDEERKIEEKRKLEREEKLDETPQSEDIEDEEYPEPEENENNSSESENEQQEDEAFTADPEEDQSQLLVYLLVLLLIIFLILLLIYFIYLIKKRLELKRLTRGFTDENLNKATMLLTSYSLSLLHYAGIKERGGSIKSYEKDIKKMFGPTLSKEYAQIIKINSKAVYSGKEINEADKLLVENFKNDLLSEMTKDKTMLQKLKMRLWDFIY